MSVTALVVEAPAGYTLSHKHLVDDQLWERLVKRIMRDESMERPLAERIMDQALGFLLLCGREPAGHYAPSPLVDIGWHAFILYTRHYEAFCTKVAKRFLHHEPSDEAGVDYDTDNVARTAKAMERFGLTVDKALWEGKSDCTCQCSDSPVKPPTA